MLNNVFGQIVQGQGRNLYVGHTSILRKEARQVLYVNRAKGRPVPVGGNAISDLRASISLGRGPLVATKVRGCGCFLLSRELNAKRRWRFFPTSEWIGHVIFMARFLGSEAIKFCQPGNRKEYCTSLFLELEERPISNLGRTVQPGFQISDTLLHFETALPLRQI